MPETTAATTERWSPQLWTPHMTGGIDIPAELSRVNYDRFKPLDEIYGDMDNLARRYPHKVRVETIGESSAGRPIHMLVITHPHNKRKAVLKGMPHPDELHGVLTSDFFGQRAAEDDNFLEALGHDLYIIPTADPDGLVLNEGWTGAPLSRLDFANNYILGYYRPPWPSPRQIDYNYPLLNANGNPINQIPPETEAVAGILEEEEPDYLVSLHNFHYQTYFHLTHRDPELITRTEDLIRSQGQIPFEGQPDLPAEKWAPGVYGPIKRDSFANYEDPEGIMGLSSIEYLLAINPRAFGLLTEVAYFDPSILEDQRPAGISLRQARRYALWDKEDLFGVAERHMGTLDPYLCNTELDFTQQRLLESIKSALELHHQLTPVAQRQIEEDPTLEREATRPEAFETMYASKLLALRYLGEVYRLAKSVDNGDGDIFGVMHHAGWTIRSELNRIYEEAGHLSQGPEVLKKAVATQIGAVLLTLTYAKQLG